MSRAWDKAKAGAAWLGKAGAIVGAVIGGVTAGLAAAALAPGAVGVIAVSALAGAALMGTAYAIEGGLIGGAAGGVYGAVTDEPREKVVVVQQQGEAKVPVHAHEMAQDGPSSTRFQTMVNESRTNTAAAQR